MTATPDLTVKEARRLALARAGLLKPAWTDLPQRASGRGQRARNAAHRIIERFGYLQLDTVSIAGARSHSIVLASRLEGFDPEFGEELLQHGEPLFEYWGHEASWIPMDLYPAFRFRRREFAHHPWWGDLTGQHPDVTKRLRKRIRTEGALRSIDMEGRGGRGWWDLKVAKKIATALWSSGELAIRERCQFQRSYDLAERVIPDDVRKERLSQAKCIETLLLKALDGHGWATTGTLSRTWRLTNRRDEIARALQRLERAGVIEPCRLVRTGERPVVGWIRPSDRELAARLVRVRPNAERGVLLSPFDPVLWDRDRVRQLFDFEQLLEIFKPAQQRRYGYYCMPVLAGDRLVARFDLKAERKQGRLRVLARHFEGGQRGRPRTATDGRAAQSALDRWAASLGLEPTHGR